MSTALITGATAGIGAAFARALAKERFDLVLVARTESRLQESADSLAEEFGISAQVLPADLSDREQLARVEARVADADKPIDLLVNNAGFGINAAFGRSSVEDEQRMIDVLVTATMRLTHAAVPSMRSRGHGGIINISSVAGWIPGGTYSAAKAWTTVFSESLNRELSGSGVAVTAVCPGFTHTEFHERAEMDMSRLPEFLWLDADQVVKEALKDLRANHAISVAGRQYQALSLLTQYLPRPILRRVTGLR